jgi:APA family basic amino acid/polyamine antiporter
MQRIGFWPLTSLVVGNLLGSGVFLLPATLAQYGSVSILAWSITACGAILLSLIFAELGHKIPKSGGPYAFVTQAFGTDVGFIIAWGYWILSWISNAALLAGIAGYITLICGNLSTPAVLAIEAGILFMVTAFNMLGIKTAGKGELLITVLKIVPLIVIPLFGIVAIDLNNFPPFNLTENSFYSTLNATAFITLWGFLGLETGTVPGGQVINARKTVPMATIVGTLTAALIYVLGTVVTFGVIPNEELVKSSAPYATAAALIFGGSWGIPVAIMAIITCVGSLNGWTIVVGRIAQSAAGDGLFPEIFSRTNRDGTPHWAIMISSALTLPFVIVSAASDLIEQFNVIIDISVTFILFVYLACILAFFKLFHTSRSWNTYRLSIGLLSLAFVIWALSATKPEMLVYSIMMAATGLPVWLYMISRRRSYVNLK